MAESCHKLPDGLAKNVTWKHIYVGHMECSTMRDVDRGGYSGGML